MKWWNLIYFKLSHLKIYHEAPFKKSPSTYIMVSLPLDLHTFTLVNVKCWIETWNWFLQVLDYFFFSSVLFA